MSTRSTTHFVEGDQTVAIIYRHSDGYPESMLPDLAEFFVTVQAQTKDTRFNDPSYLAAKWVVFLADKFAVTYIFANGKSRYTKATMLDFLSVGVVMEDPFDIEYRYTVHCDKQENGVPVVTYVDIYEDAQAVQ